MTHYRNRDRYLPARSIRGASSDGIALRRDLASQARADALAARPVRSVSPEEHEASKQRPRKARMPTRTAVAPVRGKEVMW